MIVPALLTDDFDELKAMLKRCHCFTDYVQVDIMDGQFVSSKSVSVNDIDGLKGEIFGEAHLMVNDPMPWILPFKRAGAQALIYHYEIKVDHHQILSSIRQNGMKAGIAVNPATRLSDFEYLLSDVDSVLFMSVIPGFYGAAFIPDVLEKIRDFKMNHPNIFTAIDGGVKLDNLDAILASGVDMICVGSAILKASDPARAYGEFEQRFKMVRRHE